MLIVGVTPKIIEAMIFGNPTAHRLCGVFNDNTSKGLPHANSRRIAVVIEVFEAVTTGMDKLYSANVLARLYRFVETDVLWCSTSQPPPDTPLSPAGTIPHNRQLVSVAYSWCVVRR